MKRKVNFFFLPYLLWIGLFVLAPVALTNLFLILRDMSL